MDEPLLGHEVVGLDGLVNVSAMDADGNSHQHVLRSLDRAAVDLEQVGLLQGLEPEIVVAEVAVVDDGRVESLEG